MNEQIIDPKILLDDGTFKPHWKEGLSFDEYRKDKTFVSSTLLKRILIKSEKTFYHEHFREQEKEPTNAMRMGKLAHLKILEGAEFDRRYIVMPKFEAPTQEGKMSEQSGEAKRLRKEWIAAQSPESIIVTEQERHDLFGMLEAITEHETAKEFLREGLPEISGYYVDPETKIRLKFRPDFLSLKRDVISDLKKTKDCHERSFQYQIWGDGGAFEPYWYDFQLAMYCEGYFQVTGKRIKLASWLAIEENEPWEIGVHVMTNWTQSLGLAKYKTALRRLRKAIDDNHWPGVQPNGQPSYILPPEHILNKYEVNCDGELI